MAVSRYDGANPTPHRYIGLAADGRPTGVPAGSTFIAADTGALEIFDGTSWRVITFTPP
ncbi:MAG: hypothetical protein ACREH3_18330 [Geminicoccales bacterium]